jgi:hypothetical protein
VRVWLSQKDRRLMADPLEGRQFQGATLESFRDPKTRAIRVRGSDFHVVIQESGAIAIHYPDRTIRVAPGADVAVEMKPIHDKDAVPPRSDTVTQRRGAR